MTIFVNPVAGPGAGKSTLAATLFGLMKARGERVELVQEYAKELVYDEDWFALMDQATVLKEQERRQRRLRGKVDFVITDSPIPIGLAYASPAFAQPWFADAVWRMFDGYSNFTVYVDRVSDYQTYGRSHSEEEAHELDRSLLALFDGRIDLRVAGNDDAPLIVYNALKQHQANLER